MKAGHPTGGLASQCLTPVIKKLADICLELLRKEEQDSRETALERACRVGNVLFAQLASYSANNIECAIKREPTKVPRAQHRLQLCVELLAQCLEASIGNVYGAVAGNSNAQSCCRTNVQK
jgi:hypothetical protein